MPSRKSLALRAHLKQVKVCLTASAAHGIGVQPSQPLDASHTISELLARDRKAAEMVALVAEIEWELEHPTQQVSDILEVAASESECREFLAVLARKLKESVPRACWRRG